MFGRKDDKAKKRRTPRENLSQFGLDMNFDTNLDRKDDSDDSDLEAELLALTSDSSSSSKPKKARPKVIPQDDLNRMIAESMKDEGDDDDESVDENDPDLLGELNELTEENEDGNDEPQLSPEKEKAVPSSNALITLLEERLKMYQTAEANAKSAGETSRFKRFARGSKTLAEQLRAAKSGRSVKEEDIPPPVTTRAGGSAPPSDVTTSNVMPAVPVPTRSAPQPPAPEEPLASEKMETDEASNKPVEKESVPESSTTENPEENACPPSQVSEAIAKLEERRGQYRQAAVAAKRDGRKQDALNFALIVKKFDIVIEGVKSGESVDLSEIPPPPDEIHGQVSSVPDPARVNDERQASSEEPKPQSLAASSNAGPPAPKTVMEALIERLELYQKQEASAKADGNSRKERQMGRIVKQYQDAIKQHKAGRRFAMDELPTPLHATVLLAGFPPIPGSTPPVSSTPAQVPSPVPEPMSLPLAPVEPPATPHAPARSHVPTADLLQDTASGPNDATESSTKTNVRKSPASRQEKQLALLLTRQKDFKVAALQAKSRNELNQAKEYLRLAKGFDKLIEATQSGLPVDLKTLPVAPNAKIELETDFDIIAAEDCVPSSDDEVYERLLEDLKKQIQTCMRTRDHFKAIGDIASANRFENMAVHSKKDMDAVNHALKLKYPVPKFHYETRVFSIVQCCTDLTDNDLELTIIQGVNYNVPNPKDVDTYVRFELPWPSAEESQKDKTNLIKDTNNPVYDSKFTLQIQRTRACQRIFKRQSVKCEVWSRGGFFRSDTLIGTANIKLQPLESKCIVHDSFDLMDGRKAVGGKLEVKMRIRNPIVTKQVEEVTEKWLVIDRL